MNYDTLSVISQYLNISQNILLSNKMISQSFILHNCVMSNSDKLEQICASNNEYYIRMLCSQNFPEIDYILAFIEMCKIGNLNSAKLLLKYKKINIHAFNNEAFRWACKFRHNNIINWLLSLGEIPERFIPKWI